MHGVKVNDMDTLVDAILLEVGMVFKLSSPTKRIGIFQSLQVLHVFLVVLQSPLIEFEIGKRIPESRHHSHLRRLFHPRHLTFQNMIGMSITRN